MYPQRPAQVGDRYTEGGGFPRMDGHFHGKMIVVQALMDEAAYPWQADWYRSRVKRALGDRFDDRYRLYFIDHTMHTGPAKGPDTTRIVSYVGVLQQALRDVSAWVEQGTRPPASTRYELVDGQIVLLPGAAERRGLQPVVNLTANGGARADVGVGEQVEFAAIAEVPPEAGYIVAAKWDFEGTGDYPVAETFDSSRVSAHVTMAATYSFSTPGTYFPAVRVTSQRDGDTKTRYARVHNLGRVRVVVV
ncbi:MAG: hypothetical protein OXR73_25525 [Myxococcales bacterium]|nr:hypothetical protein [Myxococcales bacterium]